MTITSQATVSAASGKPVLLQPENHNEKYEALFVEIDTSQIKMHRG